MGHLQAFRESARFRPGPGNGAGTAWQKLQLLHSFAVTHPRSRARPAGRSGRIAAEHHAREHGANLAHARVRAHVVGALELRQRLEVLDRRKDEREL
ncbi:MAG: hypothetical protein ACRDKY_07975, partial [Solirubrobacteraceae bacterium]